MQTCLNKYFPVQKTLKTIPVALVVALSACGGGSDNDGNPNADQLSINLDTSRLGASGGFIDINADGFADAIIGAPEATSSVNKTGAAVLFLGSEDGLSNTIDAAMAGEGNGDFFGFSYANVGDVNDDDKDDFVIGAINAEGDAGISGAAYVYKGGEFPPEMLLKLNGQESFDKFGYAIAGGDVNDDGVNDILVSSPYTFTEDFQSGSVNIYFGGKEIDNKPDVIIKGDKVNASVGIAIATGDVNGDGVDDIIMDGHAKVFIYYGGKTLKENIAADPTPNVKIRSDGGAHGGSGFGYTLAYVGDVNNDEIGDFAIGNPRRSNPSTYDNRGSFYIFKGGKNLPKEYFEDDAEQRIVKIIGGQADDHFASAITLTKDVNGGGKKDLLIGADWADSGTEEDERITGNVYLFHTEELVVADPLVELNVGDAAKNYPIKQNSAEYGKFVAADNDSMLSGASGSEKHNGGVMLKNINSGSDEKVYNLNDAAPVADGHEDHSHH